jgi:hypothetical protein
MLNEFATLRIETVGLAYFQPYFTDTVHFHQGDM